MMYYLAVHTFYNLSFNQLLYKIVSLDDPHAIKSATV